LVAEAGLSRASIFDSWRHDMIKTVIILLLLLVGLSSFGLVVLRQVRERMAIEQALHRAHRTLKDLAMTDSLTGLGNRRRLDGILEQEIRRARRQDYPVALVMMDLDYFKLYNDTYGHPAGDRCLRRVGELLAGALKRPGDLAVRYGGEEFTLFLPATDGDGAAAIVDEVLQALRRASIEHAKSPSGVVSASAGVAVVRPALRDVTPESLMASADGALYRAKREGRDRICLVELGPADGHVAESQA
ncbi:MAG TPA: GGDEF domain-containing protein, partial [Pseudomonas sp.]|uniref:GGDEF domain-containing protein n=1 Tax=Pseudomonas sp. TaxID=306 RepID=UPI002B4A68E6